MAVTPGDFTPSTLATIVNRQDQLFTDPRNSQLYVPQSLALQEIMRRQTARIGIIAGSPKNVANVSFINTSAITASQTCTTDCDLTGVEVGTEAVPYTLDQCVQATSFKVEIEQGQDDPASSYAGSIYGYTDVVAAGLLKQKKEIEEKVSQVSLALTVAKAGTNLDTMPEYGTIVGTATNIPAAQWTADLYPFFQIEAMMNNIGSPYLLHGRNLLLAMGNAAPDARNDNERDAQAKLALIPSTWDPKSFTMAGIANVSLMIDAPAIAFAARNIRTRNVQQLDANTRGFSLPSISLGGIDFDVRVQRTCEAGVYYDTYEMKLPYFNVIANPANGFAGSTGVLKFVKTA
ncbi:hypothetical protein [Hymenobacter tenuis]